MKTSPAFYLNAPPRTILVDESFAGLPAPFFTSAALANTYANGLTPAPSIANPVIIRSFSKANGAPIDWSAYDLPTLQAAGIFVYEINNQQAFPTCPGNPNTLAIPRVAGNIIYDSTNTIQYTHNGTVWLSKDGFQLGEIKKYVAILSQNGIAAPTAAVLQNKLGVVTYGYMAPGRYLVTATGLLTNGQTRIKLSNNISFENNGALEVASTAGFPNSFILRSYDLTTITAPALADSIILGALVNPTLTIEVYPAS